MAESKEWKSWKLRKRFTLIVCILDIGMIATIVCLERMSATQNGIATVNSSPSPEAFPVLSNIAFGSGILWTALPAFLMGLYRLAWAAVVNAAADRQPFVELARPRDDATSAGRTIMLDYSSYPFFYSWAVAFHRSHYLIGFCMILNFLLSVFLVPLTSHLLVASSVLLSPGVTVRFPTVFDDTAIDGNTDLQPALGIAAAVSVFGATPPPWSTAEYAFAPFELDNDPTGNVSAVVPAYSAYLDCQVKSPSEYSAKYSDGMVTIDGNDRGCQIPSKLLDVSTNVTRYMATWSTTQCSATAHYSRFGIIAASLSSSAPGKLGNLTVLSCIPSYWKTSGRLTIGMATGKSPSYEGFVPEGDGNASEFRPFFSKTFENVLPTYNSFDSSNTFQTDTFGRIVYEYASARRAQSPLDSDNINMSIQDIYASVFTAFASTSLFKPAQEASEVDATVSNWVTRLLVVSPVAWTIAAALLLVLVCQIWLIIKSERSHSILREEPRGLLGSAVLLHDSDVFDLLAKLREQSPHSSDTHKEIEDNMSRRIRCWYDDEAGRICLDIRE